jgi:hypothetical protein
MNVAKLTPSEDSNFSLDVSFTDWIGNEIKVGSTVVYTSERRSYQGGGLSQVLATVVGIRARKTYDWYTKQDVLKFTATVDPIRESRDSRTRRGSGIVIHRVENLTVVNVPTPATV